jgi:hypothetical protein
LRWLSAVLLPALLLCAAPALALKPDKSRAEPAAATGRPWVGTTGAVERIAATHDARLPLPGNAAAAAVVRLVDTQGQLHCDCHGARSSMQDSLCLAHT